MKRGDEHYTQLAKKEGYLARSAYKLMEIDDRYKILWWAKVVLDLWCAPWAWLQVLSKNNQLKRVIWIDLKKVWITLPKTTTYEGDVTDRALVQSVLEQEKISWFDVILSDMAPDTMWMSDIDAIRCIWLVEKALWIIDSHLNEWWKFALKVFMWPWFQELVKELKAKRWAKNIVTFKPKSCRKKSKEIYIIKRD